MELPENIRCRIRSKAERDGLGTDANSELQRPEAVLFDALRLEAEPFPTIADPFQATNTKRSRGKLALRGTERSTC